MLVIVTMRENYGVPDHQFVVSTTVDMVWIFCCEDIISNVRAYIACSVVAPVHLRLQFFDCPDFIALCQDATCIDIALNVVLGSLPRPVGAPLDTRSGWSFIVSALRPGSSCIFSPEVVQNLITVVCVICILGTKADWFLNGRYITKSRCTALCWIWLGC